jgi:hypothetical protein
LRRLPLNSRPGCRTGPVRSGHAVSRWTRFNHSAAFQPKRCRAGSCGPNGRIAMRNPTRANAFGLTWFSPPPGRSAGAVTKRSFSGDVL